MLAAPKADGCPKADCPNAGWPKPVCPNAGVAGLFSAFGASVAAGALVSAVEAHAGFASTLGWAVPKAPVPVCAKAPNPVLGVVDD